jgi:nicotinate-nucleotide pyrophosphorylase (carboxylating)
MRAGERPRPTGRPRAGRMVAPARLLYTRAARRSDAGPPRVTPQPAHTDRSPASSLPPPRIGPPPALSKAAIDAVVVPALDEDRFGPDRAGRGDVTSDNVVPAQARARARLVSKAEGRLAGLDVFARVLELCDPDARIELLARDGDALQPKQVLLKVEGNARALLLAERTGLNLIQRMSGTATATARYVERCAGKARVLDTRKTTPNLRALEKYAVRCGGGENHRFGLYDEAMVKNNHLDLAGRGLSEVVRDLRRALGPRVRITAEARDEKEAFDGVEGGADVVMLDNMPPERMRELCPRLRAAAAERGRTVEIEASGGITLDTIATVAATGVDRISVGAVTHSAPSLDLSFYLEPVA